MIVILAIGDGDDGDGGGGGDHDNAANDFSIFFLPAQKVLRLTSTVAW